MFSRASWRKRCIAHSCTALTWTTRSEKYPAVSLTRRLVLTGVQILRCQAQNALVVACRLCWDGSTVSTVMMQLHISGGRCNRSLNAKMQACGWVGGGGGGRGGDRNQRWRRTSQRWCVHTPSADSMTARHTAETPRFSLAKCTCAARPNLCSYKTCMARSHASVERFTAGVHAHEDLRLCLAFKRTAFKRMAGAALPQGKQQWFIKILLTTAALRNSSIDPS